jgi:hypothetical protein
MHLDNEALGWFSSRFLLCLHALSFRGRSILDRSPALGVWYSCARVVNGLGVDRLATGFASLIVFRLLLGVMESANWPAAIRTSRVHWSPANGHLAMEFLPAGPVWVL